MNKLEYLSPEWMQEAARRLREQLTQEKMKHLTSSMLTVYINCPDGRDRAFALGTLSALVALLVLGVSDATLITERFILVFGVAVGLVMMRTRQMNVQGPEAGDLTR